MPSGAESTTGLGLTYDTEEIDGTRRGFEWRLTPGYHVFFRGIDRGGPNLGIGPQVVLREGESSDIGVSFNLGFQFR